MRTLLLGQKRQTKKTQPKIALAANQTNLNIPTRKQK